MMKFFRKHLKKLLASFMCLLLISWLGGSALESLMRPDQSNAVVATCAYGEITQREYRYARSQTAWLDMLRLNWRAPLGSIQQAELDMPSWLLLQKEARHMGVQSSEPVVRDWVRRYQDSYRKQGIPVPTMEMIAAKAKVKVEVVYDAARAFTDVERYMNKMANVVTVNAAEVRRCAEDAYSQVEVKVVALRAEMFENPQETFSEAEVQEQFDKFKNQKRSGTGLNFGYVLPPRVKVQYAKIDPLVIQEKLSVGDKEMLTKSEENLSVEERSVLKRANRYWRGNKQAEEFQRPEEEKKKDDTTTQPTESEEKGPQFFNSWKDEPQLREIAVLTIRRKDATERAEKLADWLRDQVATPWDAADTASNGFKVPVEAAKGMDYFAKKLAEVPVSLPGAEGVVVTITGWISPENVLDIPELGLSTLPNPSGTPIAFANVVFHVEGLMEIPTDEDAVGVDRSSFVTLYQPCPYAMRDADGSIYIFRPVEVDGERPPRDIEEVRDLVVDDLRFSRGYELARTAAETLHAKARDGGLQTAWDTGEALKKNVDHYNETMENPSRKAGLYETVSVKRRMPNGEPIENVRPIGTVNEAFVAACFDMRDAADSRLRTIAMPEAGTAVVVEWNKDTPLDVEKFGVLQSYVTQVLERQRAVEYLSSWMSPKQIKARNKFETKRDG